MSIALNDLALKRARLRATMQPRNDQTINELPILGLPVASDIIPAWRSGETFQTSAGLIASLANSSSTTSLGLFNVKAYGAVGNGIADDTSAINAAVAAAQLNGGGVVYFPFGNYLISSIINITSSYVGLLGVGKNMSKLVMGTAGMSAVSFSGTPGSTLANCFMIGLSAFQYNLTAAGIGVTLYYTAVCVLQDIQVSGFLQGFFVQRATNTAAERCIATFNPSVPGLNNAIGWTINGNAAPGDPSPLSGNVSSVFFQCGADMSANGGAYANVSVGSIGFSLLGANCGDLTFMECGTSFAYYGFSLNLTTAFTSDSNADIFIRNCTIDEFTVQGILIAGPGDGLAMVNITDGWIAAYPLAASPVAIFCIGIAGVRVRGTQGYTDSTPTLTMVELSSCTDCDIDVQCVNPKVGILVFGSSDCSVGGRFFANATYPATTYVSVVGSARVSVKDGSIFDGYATNGVIFDVNTTYSVLVGATFNPAHITTPVLNSGTLNQIAKNPGYNPVGNVTPPAFPATTVPVTNNSGLDLMVLVSAGTSAITAVRVGGVVMTNYTIPITSIGGAIRLPAGQTIAFTYAGGAPSWQWFAD